MDYCIFCFFPFFYNFDCWVRYLYAYLKIKYVVHVGCYRSDFGEYGIIAFVFLLIAITALIIAIVLFRKENGIKEIRIRKIVSIEEKQTISGTGGLYFLRIQSDDVYSYYYILEDGGYRKGVAGCDNTIVYEEKTDNPRVISHITRCPTSKLIKFLIFKPDTETITNEIHVPKGTVARINS